MKPPPSQVKAKPVPLWEVHALRQRLPFLTGPFMAWSIQLALHGPSWIPVDLRKLPMRAVLALVALRIEVLLWTLFPAPKRETPASVTSAPGVVIGAVQGNGDGPHSRA